MTRRTGRLSVLVAVATLAVACAQKLQPPAASIAAAAKVATGAVVQLDGAKSADPQGLPLTFRWQMLNLPPGSHAALNDPAVINPSFTADVDGTYVVQLVVSDGKLSSGPATAQVVAGPCGDEPLLVAPEGTVVSGIGVADGGVAAGALVRLSATVTDPNGSCLPGGDGGTAETFGYAWSFVSIPSGSTAKLDGAALSSPSFTADLPGAYVVSLTATSPTGITGQGTTTITAGTCGSNPPSIQEIGARPASPQVGQIVQISAQILQPDNAPPCSAGETLSYAWSFVALPAGSRARFNSPAVAEPSFTPDVAGAYAIRLEATDSLGHASAPQTLTITASGCGGAIPQVSGITAAPAAPDTGETVQLAAQIADTDATACGLVPSYVYAWQIVGQPAGSHAALDNPAASDPSFTADLPGQYDVALVVSKVELTVPPAAAPDAGALDGGSGAGGGDGGLADGGSEDAGSFDAGPPDAGPGDAGSVGADAGETDAGAPGGDAGGAVPAGAPSGSWALSTPLSSPMAVLHLTVSACGDAAPVVVANADPQPDVGAPVQLGVTVTDANASAGCALPESFAYAWSIAKLPQGSGASLNGTSLVAPSFTPDEPGEYDFRVVVTDTSGRSGTATEVVTAGTCGSASPTVVASAPGVTGNVPVGSPVQLLATANDADALAPCDLTVNLSYAWQLVEVPAGSKAQLNDPAAQNPSFTPDQPGPYEAIVTVTDSRGRAGVSTPVSVTAGSCGTLAPVPTPVIASPAGTIDVGNTVQLSVTTQDGNRGDGCSGDSCCGLAETESYSWWFTQLPPGSQARLNGANLVDPSFVPDVPAVGQTVYEVAVAATDSSGLTGVRTIDIHVASCGSNPPVISPAGFSATPVAPVLGQPTRIAAAFTDADNDTCGLGRTFTYHWTMDQIPPGSHATIDDPGALAPSFTPDVAGAPYGFSFTVTDNLGRTATSPSGAFLVTAADCGKAAPTITLPDVSANTFQVVQLGMASSGGLAPVGDENESCASVFPNVTVTSDRYAWSFLSLPPGSHAKLNDPTAANPSFVPDVAGPAVYEAQVVVTDGLGNSSAPVSQTVNVSSCGGAPAVPQINTASYPVTFEFCSGNGGGTQSTTTCPAGSGASADNPCTVTLASGPSTCPLENVLVLDARGTTDADNSGDCNLAETLSYRWELFAVPPGSNASLQPGGAQTSTAETPWVPIDQKGSYVFRLGASDGTAAPASPPAVFYLQVN